MPASDPLTPPPRASLLAGRGWQVAFALLAVGALGAVVGSASPVAAGLLLACGGMLQMDWAKKRGAKAGGYLLATCGLIDLVGGALLCLRLSPRPAIPGLILASFLLGNGLVRLNGVALLRFSGWRRQAALGMITGLVAMASLLNWPGGLERPLAAAVAVVLAGLAWSAGPRP